jgi:hypothetical protein
LLREINITFHTLVQEAIFNAVSVTRKCGQGIRREMRYENTSFQMLGLQQVLPKNNL